MRLNVDGSIFARQAHGGINRVFESLLSALARREDVEIVLHLSPELNEADGRFSWLQTRRRSTPMQFRPGRIFRGVNAMLERHAVSRYWGRLTDGIFHSTYYTTYASLRIPQVLTIHDMIHEEYPLLFKGPSAERHIADKARAAEAACAFVFPSESSRSDASKWYRFGSRPSWVVPYALADVFRETPSRAVIDAFRHGRTGDEAYILHTGSRYLHKNFPFLLRAFAAWTGRDRYRLVTVGGGATTADEAGLIADLGLQARVTVIPALGEQELAVAYHGAGAFVFPSLSEGYGFPLLEAMACGVPTVAMRAGSLPEVGEDVPLWVSPGDLDAMVAALDAAVRLDQNNDRIRCGVDRSQRRTWDDVAADYMRVYRTVAGNEALP